MTHLKFRSQHLKMRIVRRKGRKKKKKKKKGEKKKKKAPTVASHTLLNDPCMERTLTRKRGEEKKEKGKGRALPAELEFSYLLHVFAGTQGREGKKRKRGRKKKKKRGVCVFVRINLSSP